VTVAAWFVEHGNAALEPAERDARICLVLPEATETMTWGSRTSGSGKIFADSATSGTDIGFKLEREHADAAIQDPRFTRAPYVGQHGWISMDVKGVRDWGEVRALVLESYRLIAPKALWAVVQGKAPAGDKTPPRRKPRPRSGAARSRSRSGATRR
jgi:predicted DNA-binding protein (MmcQ/YjbR family)